MIRIESISKRHDSPHSGVITALRDVSFQVSEGAVEAMLGEDAEVHTDGGGQATAARVVVRGRDRVARFLTGVLRKPWFQDFHAATVNGEPGLAFRSGDRVKSVLSLRIDGDVQAVYMTLNPDKLDRWAAAEV